MTVRLDPEGPILLGYPQASESGFMTMDAKERKLVFESAMEDYASGLDRIAARTLRQLVEDGSEEPAHLSYAGLLVATAEGDVEEGAAWCRRAVERDRAPSAELFLNLARVLMLAGGRREAIEALSRGRRRHPDDPHLLSELQHLVPRAKPTFRALPRKHALNKYAGIARTLGRRLWVTFVPRVRRVPRASRRAG
jgi:predicted Zn-dependent protease